MIYNECLFFIKTRTYLKMACFTACFDFVILKNDKNHENPNP